MICQKGNTGFTLVELIIVVIIISLLAVVAVPMVETTIKRGKEINLRRSLRTIRIAIDDYKKFIEENKINLDEDRYQLPEKLEELVKGIEYRDKKNNLKIKKFLRRIPIDPMTSSTDWGLRSYQDKPDSRRWGGENVWDVFTKSEQRALDSTYYKDW
ncbi:prepilin-type N-terminal cleavage/methylation domain-containing protein [bacterium]|nr:prepilin-type N-terminal cleavage/methylation domain-containing protein [bacterium]